MAQNGKQVRARPQIELLTPAASASEAAAMVAALEQFLADTTPARQAGRADENPWQAAALRDGIAARQVSGRGWGEIAGWRQA